MVIQRPMRAVVGAAVVVLAACSSSQPSASTAQSTSPRDMATTFCALYRRDANNGQLRNWNLDDNGKTGSYVHTLRALDAVAPSPLRPDVDRILAYYSSSHP